MADMKGIAVISPMWGERRVTDRMVFSVLHQYISAKNPYRIHLVLVDDYLEGRNGEKSPYDVYANKAFRRFYDPARVKISLIKNKTHKYQGESREIGFLAADYDWFLLLDCDDMLSPNACDRYLSIIDKYGEQEQKLACIHGLLYSFDTDAYEHLIPGESIWVQSRCYNRAFIKKHDIHFPRGAHSRQSEDYPFMREFDYALARDQEYTSVKVPYGEGCDCQATSFWFPNEASLSRRDQHYPQHLSGWTMASSNLIFDFFEAFNRKNGFEETEDENMKQELLNMNIYAFYNLLDFLKETASTDYLPQEEDWRALRENVEMLRKRLYEKYWAEIIYSDVEDMLYHVRHHSDVQFTESWIGTFYDYVNNGTPALHMEYEEMLRYCDTLQFDGAGHEIHSPQVQAWIRRHGSEEKDIRKEGASHGSRACDKKRNDHKNLSVH